MEYNLLLTIQEFRECLLEPNHGPWSDDCFHKTFDTMALDGMIPIVWKHSEYKGSDAVKFKIVGTQKVYLAKLVEIAELDARPPMVQRLWWRERVWMDFYTRVMRPQALQEILPHL